MADPTVLTAVLGAFAGAIGAVTPIIIERRNNRRSRREEIAEAAADSVASWTSLNDALGREITRLHTEMDRIRADCQAAMDRQRAESEKQLHVARSRITELETDVASLRRLLGGPPK